MTSLALSQAGFSVQALSKVPENIIEKLEKAQPAVVICSDKMGSFDPLKFSKKLKRSKKTKNIGVILLTERDRFDELKESASASNVDEVLVKPFRSGQISRAVQRVSANSVDKIEETDQLLLVLKDPFLQKIFEKLLDKYNLPWQLCEDSSEVVSATKKIKYPAIVLEWESVPDLKWFEPDKMGELVVILNDQTHLKSMEKTEKVHFVTRPLSFDTIDNILSRIVAFSEDRFKFFNRSLEKGAQAMLAARISAAIFERLVNQQALRDGQWDTAGLAAEEELLRVCKEFEKLFPMRQQSGSES